MNINKTKTNFDLKVIASNLKEKLESGNRIHLIDPQVEQFLKFELDPIDRIQMDAHRMQEEQQYEG